MEGGVDNVDEDTSRNATVEASEAQVESGNENKFQKAIGAWRSMSYAVQSNRHI